MPLRKAAFLSFVHSPRVWSIPANQEQHDPFNLIARDFLQSAYGTENGADAEEPAEALRFWAKAHEARLQREFDIFEFLVAADLILKGSAIP